MFKIRSLNEDDREWLISFVSQSWGSTRIISRGRTYDVVLLPGYVGTINGQRVSLATYHIKNKECEMVTLESGVEGIGIGSALIEAVKGAAVSAGCRRLWLVTSNDNTNALRFYQKRGFHLVAVYPNAIDRARKLKPEIPLIGADGIRIRDELELEIVFPDS
ncbi:MAG: GNAT family N-acetyltransferase [Candidatus Abyssobacteria bacterium SURF_5]|uniref:GNAT family N-acetyltransferase n=1 Tax=Abyssobacteria bacterium (strain SURF_5) TaxID=2093360 RepID=A0A3A4NC99_ABYX5|nr:MAG: GNAT family N-acetyltransferase [Candidatus Abyssubacteria bacterium SURF_5]